MEKGEFSKLGEKVYVMGFTKTYAKYLGLCEKSFSEMVRKNHSEIEGFNLQMYKTRWWKPTDPSDQLRKSPNGVSRQGFKFLSYRLDRLFHGYLGAISVNCFAHPVRGIAVLIASKELKEAGLGGVIRIWFASKAQLDELYLISSISLGSL